MKDNSLFSKNSDPSKPTRDEVLSLINSIQRMKELYWEYYNRMQGRINPMEAMQTSSVYETFLNTLYFAWEIYHYGHHSDFWEEGDSMMDYMMFQSQSRNIIEDFAFKLQQHSPFDDIKDGKVITQGLLKVYNHLIDNDLID